MGQVIIALMIAIPLGCILAAMAMPVFYLLRKIFYVPFIRGKLVREAIAKGHVVTAYRGQTRHIYEPMKGPASDRYVASGKKWSVYTYEYGGKPYRLEGRSYRELPDTMTLYFIKKPGKACPANALGQRENPGWFLQYLGVAAISCVITFMVVYHYVQII